MSIFNNKTLLITGGTGSFGNAVLNRFLDTDIGEIRILSRDEKKQDDMRHEFQAKMPEVAEKISLPFGRGLAGYREVCGCVSAMSLLVGMLLQYQQQSTSNKDYFAMVQTMGEKFREENGEIVCKKLLGLEPGSTKEKKPCNDYVACAARIVGENLFK